MSGIRKKEIFTAIKMESRLGMRQFLQKVELSRILVIASIFVLFSGQKDRDLYADGLAGEYIVSDQWRTLSKFYSPSANPAFMMEFLHTSIHGVAALSKDESAKLWETGVVVPLGFYQTAGFNVLGENGHFVKNWPHSGNDDSISSSKNSNYFFTFSYAANPWRRLNVGLNLNLAYQGNFGDKSTVKMGADLGLSFRMLLHPVLGYHILGVTFKNLIAPQLTDYDKLPFSAKTYYHSALINRKIEFDLEFELTDLFAKNLTFLQKKYNEWDLFLQIGYWLLPNVALRAFTDLGDSKKLEFWGGALELNVPQVNNGRDFSILYQYKEEIQNEMDGTHSLYFKVDVGRSREEVRNRRMAQLIGVNSSELYNKAMKLYFKGDYWDAYFLYMRILTEYPDFHKNDLVTYYAGASLEELDMRDQAIKMYEMVKTDYHLSYAVPLSELGLMRIYYRQGENDLVARQYIELNRQGVADSIRNHGNYLMGETELKKGEYSQAIQYFKVVPDVHPDYVFAQHSSATAHALKGSDVQAVVSCLENCVSANVTGAAQKEIVNRSLVLLGLIYYEEDALSKAVSALRLVTPGSYYYEEALLGLGWTAMKARQFKDCIDAATKLEQTTQRFVMKAEAVLLQAYGNILEKQYANALTKIESIVDKVQSYEMVNEDSLAAAKLQYDSERVSYSYLGDLVVNTARRGKVVEQQLVDSLHNDQIKRKEKISKFLKHSDDTRRTMFFERSFDMVKDELNYVYATVQKILNSATYKKENQKIINKDKEIYDEIQKLRDEMQGLDNEIIE